MTRATLAEPRRRQHPRVGSNKNNRIRATTRYGPVLPRHGVSGQGPRCDVHSLAATQLLSERIRWSTGSDWGRAVSPFYWKWRCRPGPPPNPGGSVEVARDFAGLAPVRCGGEGPTKRERGGTAVPRATTKSC